MNSDNSPTPKPSGAERTGEAIASAGLLAAGAVFGSVGTLGASFLPLMAATALGMPLEVAGQSVSGNPGAMAVGVMSLVALPAAFVAMREGLTAAGGRKMWKSMLQTGVGKKALALSDALGGFREAAVVTAVGASGMGAVLGTYAATGSTPASMLALTAAGTATVAATAVLSGLRQERLAGQISDHLAKRRASRTEQAPSPSQVQSAPVSGPGLA